MRLVRSIGVLLVALGCGSDDIGLPEPPEETQPLPLRFQAFHVDSLKTARADQGVGFLPFLDAGGFTAGLYHLAAGAADNQDAHNLDEIYYVVNGSATLDVGGVDQPVSPGSVHYVRAGIAHEFHDITEDLDLIVIFSKTIASASDPHGMVFTLDELVATRDATRNVWNQFLTVSTMISGLYMLPHPIGGDDSQGHTFDEVNVVVSGSSTFTVAGIDTAIRPGSVVFVERGAPHRFSNLVGDVDVLIVWQQQ